MTDIVSLLLIKLNLCYYCISLDDEYYRSHDHISDIGPNRNAIISAASMNLQHSLFMPPLPPPQHYYKNQVVNDQGFTLLFLLHISSGT